MLSEREMDRIYKNIQEIARDGNHRTCLQHWYSYEICMRNRYTVKLGLASKKQRTTIDCFIWWGYRRVW